MKIIFLFLIGLLGLESNPQTSEDNQLKTNAEELSLQLSLEEKIEFFKKYNLDSLKKYVKQKADQDSNLLQTTYLDLVEGYLNFNVFQKSEQLLDSLLITETSGKLNYARSVVYRGRILRGHAKNEEALETFYSALEFVEENELDALKPEIYFGIAGMLSRNNDLIGCTKYYRLAAKKSKQNIDLLVRTNIQLCRVFNGWVTVNLDSAVYYGNLAIKISKDAEYELGYAKSLSIAAAPIIRNGDVITGLGMSKEALKYADKYNFPSLERYYLILNQGYAYETLGLYDSATFYMGKAAELRPESLDHNRLHYLILKSQKRFQEALTVYEEYSKKQVAHVRSRSESNLSIAQARYETEKKEAEIASLSQQASIQSLEIQQKNQTIIIGLVVIMFVLVAIYLVYKQRETKKQQSQTELEQRFLRSQLNPHFISNALVTVQSFMLKNDSESAALYLTKFSKLMREILENSRKEFIPVEEEISMLRNYLDIHKLRLGSFYFNIELEDNIDPELDTIPPMFVQPFVENAVEHGIVNIANGQINLRFRKDGDFISIEVSDNGKGLNQTSKTDHNSLSSTIIRERMEVFNRSLKRKIELFVDDLKNDKNEICGTKVELKVPFGFV